MLAAQLVLLSAAVCAQDQTAIPALGDADAPLSVQMSQHRVVAQLNGPDIVLDALSVRPGDLIEYRARYSNSGHQPLDVVATLPIPTDMVYVAGSASAPSPVAHAVATDNLQFGAEPLRHARTGDDGVVRMYHVPYAQYRYVRWDLGYLPPGGHSEVRLRARIAQLPIAEPQGAASLPDPAASR